MASIASEIYTLSDANPDDTGQYTGQVGFLKKPSLAVYHF